MPQSMQDRRYFEAMRRADIERAVLKMRVLDSWGKSGPPWARGEGSVKRERVAIRAELRDGSAICRGWGDAAVAEARRLFANPTGQAVPHESARKD